MLNACTNAFFTVKNVIFVSFKCAEIDTQKCDTIRVLFKIMVCMLGPCTTSRYLDMAYQYSIHGQPSQKHTQTWFIHTHTCLQVTSSICSVLHGLPPLGLCSEDSILLDSLEKLLTDLVVASHSQKDQSMPQERPRPGTESDRFTPAAWETTAGAGGESLVLDTRGQENALTGLFLIALLRGSLKSILSAVLLAAKVSQMQPSRRLTVALGSQLEALRDACKHERKDLSLLTEAGLLLQEWKHDLRQATSETLASSLASHPGEGHDYTDKRKQNSWAERGVHEQQDSKKQSADPPLKSEYSSVASDGTYLYVHTRAGIAKIGTGYGSSHQGRVYMQTSACAGTRGWLVYANGCLLYLATEGGRALHCISTTSLKEVCTAQLPTLRSDMCGPLMSDGLLLYAVSRTLHSDHYYVDVLEVVDSSGLSACLEQEEGEVQARSSEEAAESVSVPSDTFVFTGQNGAQVGTSGHMSHSAQNSSSVSSAPLHRTTCTHRHECIKLRHVRSRRLLGPTRSAPDAPSADSSGKSNTGTGRQNSKEFGSVYTCGQNRKGELGHSNCREQMEPAVVGSLGGKRIVSMAAGNESSYFLTEEGRVLTCGLNASGQLGRQTREDQSAGMDFMEELPDGKRIMQVCCFNGAEHVLVLTSDGECATYMYICSCVV
jgi:hypothetical protein